MGDVRKRARVADKLASLFPSVQIPVIYDTLDEFAFLDTLIDTVRSA